MLPVQDYLALRKAGVSAIFGPGTDIPDAARNVLKFICKSDRAAAWEAIARSKRMKRLELEIRCLMLPQDGPLDLYLTAAPPDSSISWTLGGATPNESNPVICVYPDQDYFPLNRIYVSPNHIRIQLGTSSKSGWAGFTLTVLVSASEATQRMILNKKGPEHGIFAVTSDGPGTDAQHITPNLGIWLPGSR